MRIALIALASLLCAACDSSLSPADSRALEACSTPFGGATQVTTAGGDCLGCSVEADNLAAAADGNPDTHAELSVARLTEGEASLMAKAQPGFVYSGQPARVLAQFDQSQSVELNGALFIRTLLNGEVQEEADLSDGSVVLITGVGSTGKTLFELPTTQPFDAVEMAVGGLETNVTLWVYEFCGGA